MRKLLLLTVAALALIVFGDARSDIRLIAQSNANTIVNPNTYQDLRWRSIGPTRGGRSTAAAGVRTQPNVFYMGATGGGVWKTENYGISWFAGVRRPDSDRIDRRDRRRRLEPERRLRRHRQRSDSIERDRRPRRLQVDRRREDVAVRGAEGSRADRPAEDPSEESRHRLRRGDRPAVRLGTGSRRVPHQGRRQDAGRRCCSSTIRPAWCRSRSTGRTPTSCTPARGAGSASRGRSSAAGRRPKAASTRRPTAAITGRASATDSPTI